MLVKLLVGRSGSEGSHAPGEQIIVEDAEAIRMFEAGHAVPAREDGLMVERAVAVQAATEAVVAAAEVSAGDTDAAEGEFAAFNIPPDTEVDAPAAKSKAPK